MTSGEKEGFIVAVKQCWNVGALSSAALRTKVVVRFRMKPNGKPDTGSFEMAGFTGTDRAAAKQAYEAGRRAVIRCGAKGFDLPSEKYEQWKIINLTFNPENMRFK